jgi:hypothetical protein
MKLSCISLLISVAILTTSFHIPGRASDIKLMPSMAELSPNRLPSGGMPITTAPSVSGCSGHEIVAIGPSMLAIAVKAVDNFESLSRCYFFDLEKTRRNNEISLENFSDGQIIILMR